MLDRFELFATTITQMYKNLQRVKMQEMAGVTDMDLRGTHVMCLFQLNRHKEGLTVTQLSTLCEEDKAATSRTVSELIQKQLVAADTEKKYRAPITLTEDGQKVANLIDKQAALAVQIIGQDLTEEDREQFYRSLNIISENLKNYLND